MKLNGSMLVAVAMMMGSLGALGCKGPEASAQPDEGVAETPAADTAAAPEAPAATEEKATIQAKLAVGVTPQAQPQPLAPPPERYENPGRAPSRDHVWTKGHWQRERAGYVWVNGHWSNDYVPTAPPPARYENPGRAPSARHFWVNGSWKHVNGRFTWSAGRWDERRDGRTYVQPRYERVNGRVRYVPGHWVNR